ncbi:myosin heavy chain [Forsythia ovata]|uniref:Myosin heavy chain n=1 Tax=Forsythia ovata TaxID=205694 RepID=A0ABD1S2P1_9LAMI
MAISLILLPAILTSLLLSHVETNALDSSVHNESASFCTQQQNQKSLPCELEELKLKVARLESILEESSELSNAKNLYIREIEKKIEQFTIEIDRLRAILSSFEVDSLRANQRLNALDKKVRLLWDASRRNNFEIHSLEHKALDAERRLKVVTSQVEEMAEIVSEQWIQIQQLEQAVHMAEMRMLKFKREIRWTRCPFVKFIKTIFDPYLKMLNGILDPYLTPVWGYCKSHVLKTFSACKALSSPGFVKRSMESNELTAALAHEEVIFFLASALVAFPVVSAFMLLTSQVS